ncbi:hypothetical protein AAG747_05845 [Rapidithrix thailandica]|uniref:Uncharacterized protein n=1 Tax=Rapidithrix thailandica TaxID=413964 RepID=A0AAW9S0S8_9BACT
MYNEAQIYRLDFALHQGQKAYNNFNPSLEKLKKPLRNFKGTEKAVSKPLLLQLSNNYQADFQAAES